MSKILSQLTLVLAAVIICVAQTEKPWRDWSKSDADKILSNSAWAHTQVETDTSELIYSPTGNGTASTARADALRGRTTDQQSINNSRADRGATNQAVSVNYRVRLLSARPVRQAFMRVIELTQKKRTESLTQDLTAFVKRDFNDYIVVAMTVDSIDQRFANPPMQILLSSAAGTLKNKSYLERSDGKRVFLLDYHAPINDGLGAKFVFPRLVDNQKFLSVDGETFRFYCELSSQLKINVTFKLADMTYEGKLEY